MLSSVASSFFLTTWCVLYWSSQHSVSAKGSFRKVTTFAALSSIAAKERGCNSWFAWGQWGKSSVIHRILAIRILQDFPQTLLDHVACRHCCGGGISNLCIPFATANEFECLCFGKSCTNKGMNGVSTICIQFSIAALEPQDTFCGVWLLLILETMWTPKHVLNSSWMTILMLLQWQV